MIAYVKGELVACTVDSIVVDNQGIGYRILVPGSVVEQLPAMGSEVKIYTYMNVREDAMQLFGFLVPDELEMFKLLITVNGIGPKGALSILTVMNADAVRFAILSDDAKAIAKAPGIGAKTASKAILELKDKCNLEDILEQQTVDTPVPSGSNDQAIITDAVQALVALGYSNSEALKAVKKVELSEDMTVEDVLKASLKNFM